MKAALICLLVCFGLSTRVAYAGGTVPVNPALVSNGTVNVRMDYLSKDGGFLRFVVIHEHEPVVTYSENCDLQIWINFQFQMKPGAALYPNTQGGYLTHDYGNYYSLPVPKDWKDVQAFCIVIEPNQGNLVIDISNFQRWINND